MRLHFCCVFLYYHNSGTGDSALKRDGHYSDKRYTPVEESKTFSKLYMQRLNDQHTIMTVTPCDTLIFMHFCMQQ